ncbi:hypothetical protein [Streptomyces sp. WM6378]|uniref:hypothetical protein n=1 Tax=Streptomyces sp. WM6378 TaxID=1415557 RepID=UPI00099CB8F9|nr:hypothetical protein [Streptomyces sp. WM6378]
MLFEEEWAELKDAAAKKAGSMQLASATDTPKGGAPVSGDLVVHQDDLGRVGHEAFLLHGRLLKAGDVTRGAQGSGATADAATALDHEGFTMGSALTVTVTTWGSQVKTLLQACADISNHLDYSAASHSSDDAWIGASLQHRNGAPAPVSEISKYFS